VDGLFGSIASLAGQIPLVPSRPQNRPHVPGSIEAFGGASNQFSGSSHNSNAFAGIIED